MTKTTISVAVATFNEKENIQKFLDSLIDWVDEIVVADGQSTDGTDDIIKKYQKIKLISTTNKPMFHLNKQMAIDACQSDWILQLDADEIISPDLKKEILKIIKTTNFDGFWLKRKNYFLGNFLSKGGVYPDPTIRLYKKGKGRLPCLDVHEQAVVDGQVGWLKHDLLHFSDPTFSRYLLRNDRYTSLLASDLKSSKVEINTLNFIKYFLVKPIYWFLLAFIRHRGYVDGFPGFVFAWYSSLRFPIAYIKLYELKKSEKI
jgi:glycosyltransferase involved in cell wall biosynthesis